MPLAKPLAYVPRETRAPNRAERPACGHCKRKGLVMAEPAEGEGRGVWHWYAACCGWSSPSYQSPRTGR